MGGCQRVPARGGRRVSGAGHPPPTGTWSAGWEQPRRKEDRGRSTAERRRCLSSVRSRPRSPTLGPHVALRSRSVAWL